MSSHDAHKTIADLRDHLARHDKPIAFLFGAGTSCSVMAIATEGEAPDKPLIPAVAGLTQICASEVNELGKEYEQAWSKVVVQCESEGKSPNVETILSRLRMMLGAMGVEDTLLGLNHSGIARFEETLRRTIARISNPARQHIPEETPHRLLVLRGTLTQTF